VVSLAWAIWGVSLLIVLLIPAAPPVSLNTLYKWVWAAPALYFLIRSLFMGIYVRGNQITISSWFRNYRFQMEDVSGFGHRPYLGLITRASDNNFFSSRMQEIGISTSDGAERFFPGTVMTNLRLVSVLAILGRAWERTLR